MSTIMRVGLASLVLAELGSSAMGGTVDLSTFQLDPRLEISLFAMEPDIIDPVALTFDEAGRMYVVEMRDYPYGMDGRGKPGGTIRLLEDLDKDGRADRSTLFARDLSFPTSIVPWNGGVFVAAPPEIIYLKDTNGDGVADVREVDYSGFVLGVTDSNMNSLRWGLDNRIHGVNGGNGGNIRTKKKPGDPISIQGADFSFDPATGDFSTTYQTSGGFGLVIDEFGRRLVTYNINHIQQQIIPLKNLRRFPGMLPVEATVSISDHGDMARIFAISTAQTRPNHPEQAGHFSAAGGMGFFGYNAYPEDLYRSIIVGDVVGNLMHRDVLEWNGPIFRARRSLSEPDREWIATRDTNSRMIAAELGPDGAIYIADMHRDVIEHPDYIPEKLLKTQDIRAGEDRGRIYRVALKGGMPREKVPDFSKAAAGQLAIEMEHPNQWRRLTAQRLVIERKDLGAVPALSKLLHDSKFVPARVNALWTLHGLGKLRDSQLLAALKDKDEEVRENAIQVAESSRSGRVRTQVVELTKDSKGRVRFLAALALGQWAGPRIDNALTELLMTDSSYWTRMAALSSLRSPLRSFDMVWTRFHNEDMHRADLIRDLAQLAVTRSEKPGEALTVVAQTVAKTPGPVLTAAAVGGLQLAVDQNAGIKPGAGIVESLEAISGRGNEAFLAAWKLGKKLGLPESAAQKRNLEKAIVEARAESTSREARLAAITRLELGSYDRVKEALFANLDSTADSQVQSKALEVLRTFREVDVAERLVAKWSSLAPSIRIPVLNLLLSRKPFHNALVTAIENGHLPLGELNLDLEQRRTLLRDSTPEIQARAGKFLGDEEYSNRKAVVEEWMAKLPPRGIPQEGKIVFEKACAQCHKSGTLGFNVGPDMTSVSHRSVEDLLSNILDPNMGINPAYTTYHVETKDGDLVTGILAQDTPESVTLLQASEVKTVIPRKEIVRMRSAGISLMPEGLESGLTPEDLRNLIAFLQEPSPRTSK